MTEHTVAKKYAQALLRSSMQKGVEDRVLEELGQLGAFIEANPSVREFLASPAFSGGKKIALLESVFAGRLHELTMRLLVLMVRKRRASVIPDVTTYFGRLLDEERSVLRARFVTAVDVEGELIERLKQKLEDMTGKTVMVEHEVDQSVLGGARVIMGDKIIDRTLSHLLAELKERLLAADVR